MNSSERLKVAEIAISAGGLVLALLVGVVAYLDYRDNAQLQSMRALHDAQLRLCEEVSTTSARLTSAADLDELYASLDLLSELKHGRALVLLEKPVLDELVALYNSALLFTLRDEIDDSFTYDLQCSVGEKALSVVHECRRMLARAFEREANFQISLVDADYTVGWACPAMTDFVAGVPHGTIRSRHLLHLRYRT